MSEFIRKYLPYNSKVLDFGGSDINGSYKKIITAQGSVYKTIDFNNADYIVNSYDWKDIPKDFDAVISGQALEHDLFFWVTLKNMKSVVKKYGLIIIIVPSKGEYHKYPEDCYRFYPGSANLLQRYWTLLF
jgi:hypothetical protein